MNNFFCNRSLQEGNKEMEWPCTGCSKNTLNVDSIVTIQAVFQEEFCFTVFKLRKQMAVYSLPVMRCTTIHHMLSEQLRMSKMTAWWVPKELNNEHHTKRMGTTLDILMQYNEEGKAFLDCIVTGDETWFHYWASETKEWVMRKKKNLPWKESTHIHWLVR